MKNLPSYISAIVLSSLLTLSVTSAHGVVIFSNFGADDSFDTSSSYLISSEDSFLDGIPFGKSSVGFSFTTPADGPSPVDTIELAAALGQGANILDITLTEDAGDMPGATIETFQFIGKMVTEPTGSIISANSVLNPTLSPSTQYWLVAQTPGPNTIASWFFNSIGDTGLIATQIAPGDLEISEGTRGAFRVIPEPATFFLLFVGFIATIFFRMKFLKSRGT